jgi:hypothetical protein
MDSDMMRNQFQQDFAFHCRVFLLVVAHVHDHMPAEIATHDVLHFMSLMFECLAIPTNTYAMLLSSRGSNFVQKHDTRQPITDLVNDIFTPFTQSDQRFIYMDLAYPHAWMWNGPRLPASTSSIEQIKVHKQQSMQWW